MIIEARSSYLLYYEKELRAVSDELYIATSDGSLGTKGHVQVVLDNLIKNDYEFDHAKFIGCTYMMLNCSHTTLPYHIPTMVQLNAIMLDGTGMCGCCRVSFGGETKGKDACIVRFGNAHPIVCNINHYFVGGCAPGGHSNAAIRSLHGRNRFHGVLDQGNQNLQQAMSIRHQLRAVLSAAFNTNTVQSNSSSINPNGFF